MVLNFAHQDCDTFLLYCQAFNIMHDFYCGNRGLACLHAERLIGDIDLPPLSNDVQAQHANRLGTLQQNLIGTIAQNTEDDTVSLTSSSNSSQQSDLTLLEVYIDAAFSSQQEADVIA